ncbi:hypothetical protein SKAU_G00111220 [Synaphobranchus kaupii]|uniref:Uncharacterized protein n=1 Tax=Synaphobranchus kaupii TaxID=118154 RepID=A0A9Q1G086_SYNKA|nr:hypothetical protein SKAU_G00111220 [Synaphobranchus kaupii]
MAAPQEKRAEVTPQGPVTAGGDTGALVSDKRRTPGGATKTGERAGCQSVAGAGDGILITINGALLVDGEAEWGEEVDSCHAQSALSWNRNRPTNSDKIMKGSGGMEDGGVPPLLPHPPPPGASELLFRGPAWTPQSPYEYSPREHRARPNRTTWIRASPRFLRRH